MLSVTPIDYLPDGFCVVENSASTRVFESEAYTCKFGEVMTPFHTLKFSVKMETFKLDNLEKDQTGSHKVENKDPQKKTATTSAAIEVQVYICVLISHVLFLQFNYLFY
jgi:hypothetical protein